MDFFWMKKGDIVYSSKDTYKYYILEAKKHFLANTTVVKPIFYLILYLETSTIFYP